MMQNYMYTEGYIEIPTGSGAFVKSKHDHVLPLWKGIVEYTRSLNGQDTCFAAGTRADDRGSETMFVEYELDKHQIVRLELRDRKARSSISNIAMGNNITPIKSMEDVAVAAWIGYLHIDPAKNFQPKLGELCAMLHTLNEEEEEIADFEAKLIDFEAICLMLANVPISGAEDSIPVLPKKAKGPNKNISGTFRTFPASGAVTSVPQRGITGSSAIDEYRFTSDRNVTYREEVKRNPFLLARVPKGKETFVYSPKALYVYRQFKLTENDPDGLSIHTAQFAGPAAAGKSALADQIAADQGFPKWQMDMSESSRIDDYKDTYAPYLVGSSPVCLTAKEKAINRALKESDEEDIVDAVLEALDKPSLVEAKMDSSVWTEIGTNPKSAKEAVADLEKLARDAISSLKEKLNDADPSGQTLAFRLIHGPLTSWAMYGGYLEVSEAATARKGETSKLHEIFDFSKPGFIMGAEGPIKRHPCCYLIITNNLEYEEDHPMTHPLISRMSLDLRFPNLDEDAATERLIANLGCEEKKNEARMIVKSYLAISNEAAALSLPGGMDFRNLQSIGNRILRHDCNPREIFENEVVHHFTQHSDMDSLVSDEAALLSIMDELDYFR